MSVKRVVSTVLIASVVVLAMVVESTRAVSPGQGIDSFGFPDDAIARALHASGAAHAAGGPLGHAFNISNLPETEAIGPSIAYNSNRDEYLVVWWNDRPGNDDIYGRRVSGNGALIGNWFAVAAGAGHERQYPDVAYNSQSDEYLVVWQDDNLISGVVSISGRRVSATGQLLDGEISIGGQGDGNWMPAVAYASTENKYLVVWTEYDLTMTTWALAGKEVSSTGSPGSRFVVETDYVNTVAGVDLAYNRPRNEFLVVWCEGSGGDYDVYDHRIEMAGGADTLDLDSDYDVYGRRVKMAGGADTLGPAFPIFQSGSNEVNPAVAALPGHSGQGQYLVVCEASEWIQGQLVTFDGNLEGPLIDISEFSDSTGPAVAGSESTGQYLVAWMKDEYTYFGILGRVISIDGNHVTGEIAIGGLVAGDAAVAGGSHGDFLVAFDDLPPEGSSWDVYGRLWGNRVYLPLVLCDYP